MKKIFLAALLAVALSSLAGAADTVTTTVLRNAGNKITFLFGNASDGTGESAVVKVSSSTYSTSQFRITKLKWSVEGMAVSVLFDANTDDRVAILTGHGELTELSDAPIKDPRSTGATGNILFTTSGHSAGDGYTIYMECQKL